MRYTPSQYAVALQRRARAWKDTQAVAELVRGQLSGDVDQLLSGKHPRQELKRLGYPYGREATLGNRRGPQRRALLYQRGHKQPVDRGYLPRLPINEQTGALKRAAEITAKRTETGYEIRLRFRQVKSLPVLNPRGLPNMVARGFWREINRRMLYRKQGIIKRTKMALLRQ